MGGRKEEVEKEVKRNVYKYITGILKGMSM